jgi:hypothetical protein
MRPHRSALPPARQDRGGRSERKKFRHALQVLGRCHGHLRYDRAEVRSESHGRSRLFWPLLALGTVMTSLGGAFFGAILILYRAEPVRANGVSVSYYIDAGQATYTAVALIAVFGAACVIVAQRLR